MQELLESDNFDLLEFKLNYPNLFNCNKKQCIDYYNTNNLDFKFFKPKPSFSTKDIRLFDKITSLGETLPDDFNLNQYRQINPDISKETDIWLIHHYLAYGKKENRVYKNNPNAQLPLDFNWKEYAKINPDLSYEDPRSYETHYLNYGIKENRLYKLNLPDIYNREVYRFFNKDLSNLSELELDKHFLIAGRKENRKFADPLFDFKYVSCYESYIKNITLIKSKYIKDKIYKIKKFSSKAPKVDLLIINHETSLNGASHYMYLLKNYLEEVHKLNVLILEPNTDAIVFSRYNQKEYTNCLVYERDPTLLYYMIVNVNPKKILINSSNSIFDLCANYLNEFKHKFIFHSHEIKQHFRNSHLSFVPNFVVSERIQNQWNYEPKTQSPILTKQIAKELDEAVPIDAISNAFGNMDFSKITITMCGALSNRKNYKLFIELSTYFPQYNFLWIGGNDEDKEFEGIKNLYHIPYTTTPYSYYKITDYFLLTATIDPCPYVVLENLYLNNSVITFNGNIYTDHKKNELPNIYKQWGSSIDLTNAIEAIKTFVKIKRTDLVTNEGTVYIKNNYFSFSSDYINTIING